MKYKKYTKIIPKDCSFAIAAIYEPHPFSSKSISEAVGYPADTGISEDQWVWVYYDWCCNPVCISEEKPDGVEVDKFTTDNLDFSWTTPQCAQRLVDYLNIEPYEDCN